MNRLSEKTFQTAFIAIYFLRKAVFDTKLYANLLNLK